MSNQNVTFLKSLVGVFKHGIELHRLAGCLGLRFTGKGKRQASAKYPAALVFVMREIVKQLLTYARNSLKVYTTYGD